MASKSVTKRRRHMFEIAKQEGCTIEDIVGQEEAKKYPRNMAQVRLLQVVKKLTEEQQHKVLFVMLALISGVLSTDALEQMMRAAEPFELIEAWRATLTHEQIEQIEACEARDAA